jgi:hypothetical protein
VTSDAAGSGPADVPAQVERALVEHFGSRPLRASVSFVGVEPVDVLRFEPIPDERAYVSLGMSRHPMVGGDELVRTADGPRAELVLHLRDPADTFADVWRRLAVLAAAPAVEGVVYREGMTVDLGEPLAAGTRCTGVVTTASAIAPVDTGAGPVEMIRVVPATPEELAWCRVRGAAALEERWRDRAIDLLDLARRTVDLG